MKFFVVLHVLFHTKFYFLLVKRSMFCLLNIYFQMESLFRVFWLLYALLLSILAIAIQLQCLELLSANYVCKRDLQNWLLKHPRIKYALPKLWTMFWTLMWFPQDLGRMNMFVPYLLDWELGEQHFSWNKIKEGRVGSVDSRTSVSAESGKRGRCGNREPCAWVIPKVLNSLLKEARTPGFPQDSKSMYRKV